jgi:branched-chain amino acid transport system substrate-binding protein
MYKKACAASCFDRREQSLGLARLLKRNRASGIRALLGCIVLLLVSFAFAEKNYGPGVSATEIKIGQNMPYSGPASAYSWIGKAEAAYFQMINDQGGVNGRKINLISLDDGYSPPRTVEQIRRLVEDDQVLLLFQTLGAQPNLTIRKYVNEHKVPHLFIAAGPAKLADPKNFPWTVMWQIPFDDEMFLIGKYIVSNMPAAKIGVLYQNDEFGKSMLAGLREGVGLASARMIVAEVPQEMSDPTVDSQIITLQASGADTLVTLVGPKAAAQSIRKTGDLGWRPRHFLPSPSNSIDNVLKPGGVEHAIGIVSSTYFKDPLEDEWRNDKGMQDYLAWANKYLHGTSPVDFLIEYGYSTAQTMVYVLRKCGDDLSRENVLRQATNMNQVELTMLLPGIRLTTSPTDYLPIEQMQLMRFDGVRWVRFGNVLSKR